MGSMGSMGSEGSEGSGGSTEPLEPKLVPNLLLFGRVLRAAGVHVHREAPRPIVLLADVSGSMDRYSRMLLSFASGLTRSARQVESFVFATRLTRVTRHVGATGGHRIVSRMV